VVGDPLGRPYGFYEKAINIWERPMLSSSKEERLFLLADLSSLLDEYLEQDAPSQVICDLLNTLASLYLENDEPEKAVEYYGQALAIAQEIGDRRGEGNRLANLGNAYTALNDHASAANIYDQLIDLNPDDAMAHRNRAYALIQLGRLDEAELDCQAALRLAPDHPYTHARWGQLHFARSEYRQAVESYLRVASLHSDATAFNFNIALPYLCLSQPDQALSAIRRRLAAQAHPPDLESMLPAFEKLSLEQPDLAGVDKALALLRAARDSEAES
jgi:tetratricopeptide (TPR) repeat protein